MVVEQAFSVRNSSGDDIFGDVRFQEGDRPSPVIVVCHGFTAHKDWGPFPYIGRRLASSGFVSVVFNFSHNGIGPGRTKFTEFAKFSRNTVGKELEDVRAIVDAVAVGDIARTIADPLRIGVAGHSRGGGIAILAASRDRRIGAVAGWSTVATFYRYTEHQRALWERDGYLPISIRASRTRLRFGIEVLRDLESHRDEYDLAGAVRTLHVPLLLVHGSEDVSVRLKEPETLYQAADRSISELVVVEHAGHAFGASHPFTQTTPGVERLLEVSTGWFHRHLQERA